MKHANIDHLIASEQLEEAIAALSDAIASSKADASLYFTRGRLLWRIGKHSAAMSDYAHAAELDPSSPAVYALEQARDIAVFFNPDLYNP